MSTRRRHRTDHQIPTHRVKRQTSQSGMAGVDAAKTQIKTVTSGDGGGDASGSASGSAFPGTSFFKAGDAGEKAYGNDDTAYATYMANGAIVELTRAELKEVREWGGGLKEVRGGVPPVLHPPTLLDRWSASGVFQRASVSAAGPRSTRLQTGRLRTSTPVRLAHALTHAPPHTFSHVHASLASPSRTLYSTRGPACTHT